MPGTDRALPRGGLRWLVYGLFTVGTVARIAPLFDQGGRLLRQFPTEDGYLMLTIARNLALGHGMSTAAGTIPTNGTQPLFNLIEALCFVLVGGDKHSGVLLTLLVEIAVGVAGAWAIARFGRQLLRQRPQLAESAPYLAAGLWYASSINLPHTMNCLETGLYGLLIVLSVHRWHQFWSTRSADRVGVASACQVGVLLGLTFWARIDAAFLIGAVTLTHLLMGARLDGAQSLSKRLPESILMGGVAVLVASPWLLNNLLRFGSVMPISGTAQSFGSELGNNAAVVPPKLFEYFSVVLPIPNPIESQPGVLAVLVAAVLAYIVLVVRVALRMHRDELAVTIVVGTMAAALSLYYGLFFGASHFVNRYLFPLSPFTALFAATMAVAWWHASNSAYAHRLALAGGVVALSLCVVTDGRHYMRGDTHQHFQVVKWVDENVPADAWTAAIQTGTLGFFHDRTVNLDGKVNPEALAYKLRDEIPEYVSYERFGKEGRRIDYLIDWIGLERIYRYKHYKPLREHFDLIVADPENNLAVVRRKGVGAQQAAAP